MKKLAIKANPNKGKEIIHFLESIGGVNSMRLCGDMLKGSAYYYIDDRNIIDIIDENQTNYNNDDYHFFTIEELIAKYPYTIGDTIIIDDCDGKFHGTIREMTWYYGVICYSIENNKTPIYVDSIIGKVETSNKSILDLNWSQLEIDRYFNEKSVKDAKNVLKIEEYLQRHNLVLPTQIVINNVDGITLEDFQKTCQVYLNDIEECYRVVGIVDNGTKCCVGYKEDLLNDFQDLLICYDAYCKVMGDYKPNWLDNTDVKYCIGCVGGKVTTFETYTYNYVLTFPNEQVRDTFLKNFNNLIERCKKIL